MIIPVFAEVIAPVFVLIAVGVLAGLKLGLDRRTLGRSVLYIFAPALAIDTLTRTTLTTAELSRIVAFAVLATGVLGVIVWLAARLARASQARSNALMLSTLLMNSGNYGIPLSLFAFGQGGMERAVMFFVVNQFLMYTLGVYLASAGHTPARLALLNIVRLPVTWAMVFALVVRLTGWTLPGVIAKPASLAGAAAVPILLIALGIELSRVRGVRDMPSVLAATGVRLGLSVVVGLAVAALLGVEGVTRQVLLVQFSMPTAITPLALAMEFGADPEFVTGVIFVSTVASVFSLTLLLAFLS